LAPRKSPGPRLKLARKDEDSPDWFFVTTGDSSGEPVVVAWDRDGWSDMAAAVMRAGMWFARGGEPPDRWVQATLGSTSDTSMSRRLGAFLANPVVQNHELPARAPMPELIERIEEIQPDGIFGYASAITAVAGAAATGRLEVSPMMVGTSSEPLLPPMADLIRNGFGVDPSDTLAATEIGALAARTFPGAPGLRLAEDVAVYEVDEDGMLLVTNVLNRALPLIRYRIGDRATIGPAPGDIPWTGRLITLLAPAACEPVADAMAGYPAIIDYSVTKSANTLDAQVWTPRDQLAAEDARALAAKLGGAEITVVDDIDDLPRTPAGKRIRFVGF